SNGRTTRCNRENYESDKSLRQFLPPLTLLGSNGRTDRPCGTPSGPIPPPWGDAEPVLLRSRLPVLVPDGRADRTGARGSAVDPRRGDRRAKHGGGARARGDLRGCAALAARLA